ncbi:Nucleoporin [Lachnellula occidentalis]|uniref:Nucleoporin n=1 Tax=Lachnellula occidentalis TaxID=215460 RepID=A0A8H8RP10_9HELO|nr:Nucleoporin [Lachnellula occidentalis]
MAFSFGNPSMGSPAGGAGGGVQNGQDLETIQTEALGFLALAGDAKVQLLPTPWPINQLPPATASLMSIASRRGLIAAAGPDAVILARTKSVRKAFEGNETGNNNLKPFQPELTLPMQMRVSQLTFSIDESYLVLSAENGGGLAVYDVDALLNGATNSAFELSTNGQSLRALTPNPTQGELLAVVTVDGNLMMANLKERSFVTGPNGQVLKDGVSCVSWSTKGKQLVAGLGNGTAYQMTPAGEGKGDIPKPPDVASGNHVSSITWLENHVFLMVHTPTQFGNDQAPQSVFHVVTRQPPSSYMFQKIEDPAGPFGINRSPPHHFLLRLKDFPPNLQDIIFVTSSAATDVGLFSRSKTPLTNTKPADKISGVFTMTEFSDDSKRAQLPVSSSMGDTSAIGLALDLSSDEKVFKPIPGDDEINESSAPLPALMLLNHEGALASWWFVYCDSVRQGTAYPGLIAAGGATQTIQSAPAAVPAQTPSIFGGAGFQNTSSAGGGFSAMKPATTPAFSAPSLPAPSTTGAFGTQSGMGPKASPWGTPAASQAPQNGLGAPAFGSASTMGGGSAFGKPAFGSTSSPAFGNAGMPGRQSVWGSGGSTAPQAAFGQASSIAKPAAPFGSPASTGTSAPSTGGFSAFASNGGFAAATQKTGGSVFGKLASGTFGAPIASAPSGVFGSPSQNDSKLTHGTFGAPTAPAPTSGIFGSASQNDSKPAQGTFGGGTTNDQATPSLFGGGTTNNQATPSLFGGGAQNENKLVGPGTQTSDKPFGNGFNLVPSFKADTSKKNDEQETDEPKSSFFGGGFSGALGESGKKPAAEVPVSNETNMDSDDVAKPEESTKDSTTPSTTPASAKFQQFSTTPSSLFGSTSPQAPQSTTKPATAGFGFGQPTGDGPSGLNFSNLANVSAPAPKTPITSEPEAPVTSSETPATPKIKAEPESSGHGGISPNIQEAPLPPESTSKTSYAAGESSESSFSSIETDIPTPSGSTAKSTPNVDPALPAQADQTPLKPLPKNVTLPMDVPGGPEDDGGSSDFFSEDDEDDKSQEGTDEGSGEDVTKDLSPTSETNQTPGFTPQSSFNLLKKENSSNSFQKVEKPSQPAPRTLFGEGVSAPSLPPPKPKQPLSPRSPSPLRAGAIPSRLGLGRPDPSRSVSAPGTASQLLGQRPGGRPPNSIQNTYALAMEQSKAEEKRREEARARKEAEVTRALVDEEDDEMQRYLADDPEPTRTLVEFTAHTDHASLAAVDSIPAQVEAVYRDINSMIDTLGLNAKHLRGFIQAHTEQYKEAGRQREDLENEEDWVLVEIEDLNSMVDKRLTADLNSGRIKEVAKKLETCSDLQKELIRLRAKHEDVKKIIDAQRDPGQLAQARAQPLSAEQQAQQNDLRQVYTKFQLLLAEAEEGLTLLKTKLVSQATSNGRAGASAGPTVEAVMRTITKMTSMAEKRSGDIDVLEGQMRKLRVGSSFSASSREGTPFTPQSNRHSMRNAGASSTYGLFHTPERETPRNMRDSILSNSGSFAMSSPAPRKKLSGYSPEEKALLKAKLARRKGVVEKLRSALQKAGSNVRLMDDDQ